MDNRSGFCDWIEGDGGGFACRLCGELRASPRVRQCPAGGVPEAAGWPPCKFLGDGVEPILVDCQTCRGEVRVKTSAHVCHRPEFARCLPAFTPADRDAWDQQPESLIYHLCVGCEFGPG